MAIADIWNRSVEIFHFVWAWVATITVDDFYKVVLAVVALIALFLGPRMQWRIAKRQVQMQAEIADKQVHMQADIAKLQVETQSRIATRQIADNISSKRQSWIDELRKDSAEFLTVVARIQELKRPRVGQLVAMAEIGQDFKDLLAAEMRAKELGTRIKLRLNPNEADHNRLVELISEMSMKGYDINCKYGSDDEIRVAREFNHASNAVVGHLQTILKHEWERVKKGDI